MRLLAISGAVAVIVGAGLLGPELVARHNAEATPGQVLLVHHATADQGADARQVVFDDCATQRNLSDRGRVEAQQMGASLRELGFRITKVIASPFCRTLETARLMQAGPAEPVDALQNIRDNAREDAATLRNLDEARRIIASWRGPGALLIVTHGSTIKALTGADPVDGEFVVYTNPPRDEAVAGLPAGGAVQLMETRTF
jgi:phosphohistidine phosphatase SixA